MARFILKSMMVRSIYNTITIGLGEEVVVWIISHLNINPSCV